MVEISELPSIRPIPKQLQSSRLNNKLKMKCEIISEVKKQVAGIALVFTVGPFKGKIVF
jgi:hypothetical protein